MPLSTFQRASRLGVRPLIALYGESNSGKTFSALLMARGIAGPKGKIALIDTESGRGALYADQVPGGFDRADFEPPFSPEAYIEALDAAEAAYDVIVFDSFSHEWEGQGGVCEQAGDNEAKTGKAGLHNWNKPKQAHKQLILRLQRTKKAVIVCLRAMYKTKQVKDGGKTAIVKDDFLTAIQSEGFTYDATVVLEMARSHPGHYRLTKWSTPDLKACFPAFGVDELSPSQVSVELGNNLRGWIECSKLDVPIENPVTEKPVATKSESKDELKKRLWNTVKAEFQNNVKAFQQHLIDETVLDPDQTLSDLTESQMNELIRKYSELPA